MSDDLSKRRDYLAQLRRMLPASEPWESWLESSSELPPDFDALPSHYYHPDLLDGIRNKADWQQRRAELKAALHQWIVGSVPPPPADLHAEVLDERRENGATVRDVQLSFAGGAARLWLQLLIPDGDGPFPVFMTQHNHRNWAQIALSRGYIGCVYAGADSWDDTDTFVMAYPDYDWSRIMRRAWAASRCVDYLYSEPLVDNARIAITGHSRNGKLSLIASALDERFSLVISSSSGAGGDLSARFKSEQHFGEGVELMTRRFPDWFHPRWRFFVGREHKLPVDIPDLIALSAPRPCLFSIALNDPVSSGWALEQVYHAVNPVYRFLGASGNLRILWRGGSHETWPEIIERYIDWCDLHFGRGSYQFPEQLVYPHRWDRWQTHSGLTREALIPPETDSLPDRITAMLGAPPPAVRHETIPYGWGAVPHIDSLMHRVPGPGVEKYTLDFGEHIMGDVYLPAGLSDSGEKAPAVLWLHPWSSAKGYVAAYRRGEPFFNTLAQAGFVVFCFDHIGCGQRSMEIAQFYTRHPRWSLLGKMLRDSQAALDCLLERPEVDTDRVYGLGYAAGGLVGLHLAALDERLAGFAGVCVPPPLRTDTDERETGGIRRWSHQMMLWPQLGWYAGRESEIPYDLPDLMANIAPRPLLIVSPQLDREAPLAHVSAGVDAARAVYDQQHAGDALTQLTPETYNHFDPDMQALVIDWLRAQ